MVPAEFLMPTPAAAPVREGDIFDGKFRVERVLGAGGMGVVVAAVHLGLGTRVALKFVGPDLQERPDRLDRLRREARAAAQIESEHVGRVLDLGGLDEGTPYVVLEYLDGCDLANLLDREGPLAPARAVDLLLEACEAIAEAHARGIVHRDLKPANLFLARRSDGTELVKVLDFGIAKQIEPEPESDALTRTNDVLGSPRYMSPEQLVCSSDVTGRSDVWALGVILFELLTGETPFKGDSAAALVSAILNDMPQRARSVRASVPKELDNAIARCLERDRTKRTASVAELAAAIAPLGSEDASRSLNRIERWARTSLGSAPSASADTQSAAIPSPRRRKTSEETLERSALDVAIEGRPAEAGAANVNGRRRRHRTLWFGILGLAAIVLAAAATAAILPHSVGPATSRTGEEVSVPLGSAPSISASAMEPGRPAAPVNETSARPDDGRRPASAVDHVAPKGSIARPLGTTTASASGRVPAAPVPPCPDPMCARK
jgi:serine/threonine-protein kinase